MHRVIYLDMDGVLADFDKAATALFGHQFSEFPTSHDAWTALLPHQDFYLHLDPMPDADLLVSETFRLAEEFGWLVRVLTAIPRMQKFPRCTADKQDWLKKHYPLLLQSGFHTGPYSVDKQHHCQPGYVLIDDRKINIQQWNAKGGYGIRHISAEQSLGALKKYLESVQVQ